MNKGLYVFTVPSPSLAANSIQTLLQVISGPLRSFEVVRWGVSFSGVDPAEAPVVVELLRQTSVGTGSPISAGPAQLNPSSDTTAITGFSAYTAEPVPGDVLERHRVTPYGGLLVMQYAPDERPIVNYGAQRIGIRCTAAAVVVASAFMVFTE